MTQAALPVEAVEKDHRLEAQATKASEALAKHRWHWTLDESNPDRVTFTVYARAVGRARSTITAHAEGYAAFASRSPGAARTLSESIERAKMSVEKAELVEAVADANAITFKQASQNYASDVARLRDAVEAKVEKEPDLTPEERTDYARKVANMTARSRQVDAKRKEERKNDRMLVFVNIDAALQKAKRSLIEAATEARGAEMDPELVPRIEQALDQIKALTEFVRMAVLGTVDVDWDEELRKLEVL